MTVLDRRTLTSALVSYLATATGRQVGAGTAPLDPVLPYAIVYPLPGGATWGPEFWAPDAASDFPYQITSVGDKTDQAEWMADKVRQAMLARTSGKLTAITWTGGVVADRQQQGLGGVIHEGEGITGVVTVPDTYVLRAVPV